MAKRDHPRGCGEQLGGNTVSSCACGSPPRMRGTGRLSSPLLLLPRITPADAGNRGSALIRDVKKRDHPRGCGEQMVSWGRYYPFRGSPPRMRGTGKRASFLGFPKGITPADAGNSTVASLSRVIITDHPRGCGEQIRCDDLLDGEPGSPPRMRGTAYPRLSSGQARRITPADAGNSRLQPASQSPRWDHPRGCGEQK